MKESSVKIWTDGACSENPGPGGWAALLQFGKHKKEISGGQENTTNNRMELLAAINALQCLNKPCKIDLYTDSKYVKNGITLWLEKWKKQNWQTAARAPVKNKDLWQALEKAVCAHEISWHWVKGHSGNAENELVDNLARKAIIDLTTKNKNL